MLLLAARARPGSSARSCCSARPTAARCSPGWTSSRRPGQRPGEPAGPRVLGALRRGRAAAVPRGLDLVAAARGLPRVLLAHARDDDAVPFAHSERLAAVLAPPSRFIVLERGRPPRPGPLAGGRARDDRLGAGERRAERAGDAAAGDRRRTRGRRARLLERPPARGRRGRGAGDAEPRSRTCIAWRLTSNRSASRADVGALLEHGLAHEVLRHEELGRELVGLALLPPPRLVDGAAALRARAARGAARSGRSRGRS